MSSALWVGFVLGLRHAMEADHVAAVAGLASGRDSVLDSAAHGIAWGLGHCAGLWLVCALLLALPLQPPTYIAPLAELLVGVMMVYLGADLLRQLRRPAVARRASGRRWPVRALAIGGVHGVAGATAVSVLFFSTGTSDLPELAQVLLFGIGSVCGMAGLSSAIGVPVRWSARRESDRLLLAIRGLAAFASIAVGVYWVLISVSGL